MTTGILGVPEFRQSVGISDEQYQEIQNAQINIGTKLLEHPEYQEIMAEMTPTTIPTEPFADEEVWSRSMRLQERSLSLVLEIQAETIDSLLTPEQKDKTAEALLANMGAMPIVSPDMFSILGLTDAQREQMEEIKKELEPTFEQQLEDYATASVFLANKLFEELEKHGMLETFGTTGEDPQITRQRVEEFGRKSQEIMQKLMENDPEYKRRSEEIFSKGKAFAVQFQTRMFDVLTDEQWNRLLALMDNPPEHAKILLAHLKKAQGESGETNGGASGWAPGPDSWRPGVAIPEQYRRERNTRGAFPRPQ